MTVCSDQLPLRANATKGNISRQCPDTFGEAGPRDAFTGTVNKVGASPMEGSFR